MLKSPFISDRYNISPWLLWNINRKAKVVEFDKFE